jgi:hypothetical protein
MPRESALKLDASPPRAHHILPHPSACWECTSHNCAPRAAPAAAESTNSNHHKRPSCLRIQFSHLMLLRVKWQSDTGHRDDCSDKATRSHLACSKTYVFPPGVLLCGSHSLKDRHQWVTVLFKATDDRQHVRRILYHIYRFSIVMTLMCSKRGNSKHHLQSKVSTWIWQGRKG